MQTKSHSNYINNLKIFTPPKIKAYNYINNEEKNISKNMIRNIISTQYESIPKNNYNFNYNYKLINGKKNIIPSEKSLKIEEDNPFEEKRKRKLLLIKPLDLSNDFNSTKILFPNKNSSKLSSISLSLINLKDSKPFYYNDILTEKKIQNNEKNVLTINSSNKKIKKVFNNLYNNKENQFFSNKRLYKYLTEDNLNNYQNKKKYKKLLIKNFSLKTSKYKKFYSNNNSYDNSKKIISKINRKNEKIRLINGGKNDICSYIKVNKKNMSQINTSEAKGIIDIKNNKIINEENNDINDKKIKKIENIKIKGMQRVISQKILDCNIKGNNDNDDQKKKNLDNTFNINKIENNIFLDKTYQNRFKKQPKNNKEKNDIFTREKQREYNAIIVKKKSNYLNNLVSISTISTSNSSSNKNKSNTTKNNKNIKSNRNWVHRLYNDEIKKQKIKNKIIYKLRKSILKEQSPNKPKKNNNKYNSKKDFNYNNFTNNKNFNFDEKFNIISLFLTHDKKNNSQRIKKYKDFYSYPNKIERYSYDDNMQISENDSENSSEEEKMNIIMEDKINPRKSKKIVLLYNEELINEEDEEKEKDEDEK